MQNNKSVIQQIGELILAHKRPSALSRLITNRSLRLQAAQERPIEYIDVDQEKIVSLETMRKQKSQKSKLICTLCFQSVQKQLDDLDPNAMTYKRSKILCQNCTFSKLSPCKKKTNSQFK